MNYKYENNTKLRIVLLLDKKTNLFVIFLKFSTI